MCFLCVGEVVGRVCCGDAGLRLAIFVVVGVKQYVSIRIELWFAECCCHVRLPGAGSRTGSMFNRTGGWVSNDVAAIVLLDATSRCYFYSTVCIRTRIAFFYPTHPADDTRRPPTAADCSIPGRCSRYASRTAITWSACSAATRA